jgi:hypothetical protein
VNCFLVLLPGASPEWKPEEDVRLLSDSLQTVTLLSSDGKDLLHYVTDDLSEPVPIHFPKEEEVVYLKVAPVDGWELFPLWIEDRLIASTIALDTAAARMELHSEQNRYFLQGQLPEQKQAGSAERRLHIIPNPLAGQVMRVENPEASFIRVVIIDSLGRPVEEFRVDYSLPVFERKLELSPGIYTALLYSQNEVLRERFIISE